MTNGLVPIVLRRCDLRGTIYVYIDDVEPVNETAVNIPEVSSSLEDLLRTQL